MTRWATVQGVSESDTIEQITHTYNLIILTFSVFPSLEYIISCMLLMENTYQFHVYLILIHKLVKRFYGLLILHEPQ